MNDYEILAELKKQTKIMEKQAESLRGIDINTFLITMGILFFVMALIIEWL